MCRSRDSIHRDVFSPVNLCFSSNSSFIVSMTKKAPPVPIAQIKILTFHIFFNKHQVTYFIITQNQKHQITQHSKRENKSAAAPSSHEPFTPLWDAPHTLRSSDVDRKAHLFIYLILLASTFFIIVEDIFPDVLPLAVVRGHMVHPLFQALVSPPAGVEKQAEHQHWGVPQSRLTQSERPRTHSNYYWDSEQTNTSHCADDVYNTSGEWWWKVTM